MARWRERMRGDSGTSLVEILVSVVILGIGVVGIMSALGFLFSATTKHRDLAESNTVALTVLEYLADPDLTPYEVCPVVGGDQYEDNVAAAVAASPPDVDTLGWTVTVVAEVWNGTTWTDCGTAAADPGLQKLKATTTGASGQGTVLELVKRRTS
ncbi:MAG: hypothetical protein OEW42_21055 [Acidimicrobiia bacterium]|nr:hypothetical protein [Acidimicrobiia bacterium]